MKIEIDLEIAMSEMNDSELLEVLETACEYLSEDKKIEFLEEEYEFLDPDLKLISISKLQKT